VLGAGFFAAFIAQQGVVALALPYYQMLRGLDPLLLGALLSLPIVCGAMLSGRIMSLLQRQVWTERRIILTCGWVTALLFGLLWMVPADWPMAWQWAVLVMLCLCYSLSMTVLILTLKLLAFRLALISDDGQGIFSRITLFEKIAAVLYFWLFPLTQLTLFTDATSGVRIIGWLVGLGLIGSLCTLVAWQFAPERVRLGDSRMKIATDMAPTLSVHTRRQVNQLLWISALQFGAVGICISFDYYLLVYFVAAGDVTEGSTLKGALSSGYAIAGALYLPILAHGVKQWGAVVTLQRVLVFTVFGCLLKWYVYTPYGYWALWIDAVIGAAIWTAMTCIIPNMLTELGRDTGQDISPYLVSRHHTVISMSLVLAMLGSGELLNLVGFDASLAGNQTDSTLFAMRLLLSFGSFIFTLGALMILSRYKADRLIHS